MKKILTDKFEFCGHKLRIVSSDGLYWVEYKAYGRKQWASVGIHKGNIREALTLFKEQIMHVINKPEYK